MDRNWVFIIHERSVMAAEGNWEREVRIFRAGHPWKGRGAPPWLSLPLEPHSSMLSPSHRHLPALIIQDTPSPPLTPLTTQMYTHTLALFLYTCECDLYCTLYTQTHTFSLSLSLSHTHTHTHTRQSIYSAELLLKEKKHIHLLAWKTSTVSVSIVIILIVTQHRQSLEI